LSCSIYQWTTAAEAAQGELPYALNFLKTDAPESFQNYFGSEGLDVKVGANAMNGLFVLHGKLLDTGAKKSVLRTNVWAYRFWRAAHDPDVRRAYVKAAISRISRYYLGRIGALGNCPMSDYISSEVGVAHILDQHVNRPGHVPKTLVAAIQAYIEKTGASDPTKWKDVDEQDLLKIYLKERSKTNMTDSDARAKRINDRISAGKLKNQRFSFVDQQ
jgi:hypothetical protein